MLKKIVRNVFLSILAAFLIFVLLMVAPALWRRWITYPGFEGQIREFQSLRIEPPALTSLNTYRGVLHAHSYWSHDSEGTLNRIIAAAKKTGIEFIFLTDHPHADLDTFPRGYNGYYDDILIEPGSERHGYCAWPLDSTVIDWRIDRDTVIKKIVSDGGMFFYAHSEEDHNWGNPYYQGMEIYNIHTDTKDESLLPHIVNFIVNGGQYRHWALRAIFDEQSTILSLWDSLNSKRKIVGFSAVDAHENQNFRARFLDDGRVEWLGPNADAIDTVRVTFWNEWMFHEPDEDGWVFELMIDTYETSFNHVTNYVLADSLSVNSLAHNIKAGHLYIGFKGLGDAKGFMFTSKDNGGAVSAIIGDSVQVQDVGALYAVSPLPGEFRLLHDGKVIGTSAESAYEYEWSAPISKGAYRIEIHLKLDGEKVPWVYSNPIYVY